MTLEQDYDKACEAHRAKPTTKTKEKKDALAAQIVVERQAERVQREAEAVSLGNGVAAPGSVTGKSGVS